MNDAKRNIDGVPGQVLISTDSLIDILDRTNHACRLVDAARFIAGRNDLDPRSADAVAQEALWAVEGACDELHKLYLDAKAAAGSNTTGGRR